MKKIFLVFLALLMSSSTLVAQTALGIYGGPVSAKFSGDAPKKGKFSSKSGFIMGITADFSVKEDVLISVMPSYLSGGANLQFLDSLGENYQDSVNFNFTTFSLPVLMKIISDNQKWQFSGGLELSVPLTLEADDGVNKYDLMDDIKNTGLNVLFGVGYRIPVGKSHIIIDLAYTQGLLNIVDNLDENESFIPRMKPTSFRLTAAWNIRLGKNNTEN